MYLRRSLLFVRAMLHAGGGNGHISMSYGAFAENRQGKDMIFDVLLTL